MRLAQPVGVVVGVALMATPALGDYSGSAAGALHRVIGPVVASLALIAVWEATAGARWPNVALGAALVLAPLLVEHPGASTAVGVGAGLLLVATTAFAGSPQHRYGDGWAGLRSTPDPGGRERSTR